MKELKFIYPRTLYVCFMLCAVFNVAWENGFLNKTWYDEF